MKSDESKLSTPDPTPLRTAPDPKKMDHRTLLNYIFSHPHAWWWVMLYTSKPWLYFVPWPLGAPINAAIRYLRGRSKIAANDEKSEKPKNPSMLFTCTLAVSYVLIRQMRHHVDHLERYSTVVADASKALVSGAFLLGTILSVSVSLPGQTVVKFMLGKKPIDAVNYVIPFAWAFMWGLVGALLLMFYNTTVCRPYYQYAAVTVGVYGAAMEINALAHVVKIYTMGLILLGVEERAKAEEKARAKAEEAARKIEN